MISEESINKLVAKYQTNALNVRREYFQHLFLSYFYQQPKSECIYFKGGTNLRVLYHSPRFSEDLDFNCAFVNFSEIEELMLNTLHQMEKENMSFILKEAKQTSGGFLAIVSFESFNNPIDIQIEISQRNEEKKGETMAISNDYIPFYNVISVTENQLVFEKIRALLARKKPRDFYDLYFILRKQMLIPDKNILFPKVLTALRITNINFEVELKQFLPASHWAIIKDFKATLEREINRFK